MLSPLSAPALSYQTDLAVLILFSAPFPEHHCKGWRRNPTSPDRWGWFMAHGAGSLPNSKAWSRCALGLLEIDHRFCVSISCSSTPPQRLLITSLKCHLHIQFLSVADESWAWREIRYTEEEKKSFLSTVLRGEEMRGSTENICPFVFPSPSIQQWGSYPTT